MPFCRWSRGQLRVCYALGARGTNAPRPDGAGRPSAWSRSRAPSVPRWCSFPSPRGSPLRARRARADVVGDIVGKRRVGVDRPAAEIERVDVARERAGSALSEARPCAIPAAPWLRTRRLELDRRETGRQRLVEPDLDALVEHRVDLAARERREAANVGRPAAGHEAAAPGFDVLERKAVQRERLLDQHQRRMGGILAHRDAQRIALRLDVGERADARARVDHEHEAVPARIDRDDAHGQRRAEQADAAIGLREQRRGIDEGEIDAAALRYLLGENGGAGGEPQPWPEGGAGAAADGDDHVAVAAIGRRRIAGDMQADLPQRLGAHEVSAFR